jgi:(p)ppGpp synthase/HD superfamily hydrolase
MIYTPLLHKAFHYAIKIHETDQKQKRKGKDVPYVTHLIHVGMILAKAGASDELIAAGFLHDTV